MDEHARRPADPVDRLVRVVAVLAGLFYLAFGVWALVAPASFYRTIATYPPYNEHLLHDLGAFQAGLGSVLLLARRGRDPLLAALAGVGVGSVLHAVAHVVDRDLGGRATDPVNVALVAALVVLAAALRARRPERARTP